MNPCCTILMNSKAGRFRLVPRVEDMRSMLQHLNLDMEVVATTSEAHMVRTLRELVARKTPRIAIAGGDGTVHTAVQMLAGTDSALGIIPQGTANNVATALRLPHDLPSALRTLQDGEVTAIDLGYTCKQFFIESAGVGLFANALALYGADSNKNLWRSLYAVARIVFDLRPRRLHLTIDGQEWEEPAVFCVAANTFRMAHALPIAPGAKLTDGLLDIVILGDLTRSELIPYYRAIRRQIHSTLPKTRILQARKVEMSARRKMPVHVDDKVRGATPVTIEVRPKALKVVVERL